MWKNARSWIVAAVVAAVALGTAATFFEEAFPVVALDLEVTRDQVVERARLRAREVGWELADARTAVSFGLQDRTAKIYVELEGGGREAWSRIVSDGDYRPYLWTVRLFEPGRAREARVRFAPDGSAEGFSLEIPEDEAGPTLTGEEARRLAESDAAGKWGVSLDPYRLVETSQEIRPGGRTDHAFVYERRGVSAGEARFRLRLEVAGDRLSEVRRDVLVPEAFERRYSEMRSSNELLAFASSLGAGFLYVLLGCGVGLFVLLREGRATWRGPVTAGLVVAGLLCAARLNRISMAWMSYDTAVAEGSFLLREIGVAAAIFVGGGILVALVFVVAEGLTRKAFGHHPALWTLWRRGAGNSRDILGRTLGGYLFTALFIPYSVGFYFLSTRIFGWWTPAEALVQPDLIATPLPWLSAVATALFAGTFEEALYRAVPLAGAALLGDRTGRRRLWIGAGLLLQAAIFASGHANYPQQPAYARFVELLLPALAFGVLYLRYGLLTAVLGHFTYNLVWMSLPLWASSAPGVWIDRTMIVFAGLAPLAVILVARARWGVRERISASALNRAWSPASRPGAEPGGGRPTQPSTTGPTPSEVEGTPSPERFRLRPAAVGAGLLAGLLLWGMAKRTYLDAPVLEVTRSEARALVRDSLAALGAPTDAPWRTLVRPRTERERAHRFVWRALGEERYRSLVGTYLSGPGWAVRHARFEGSVEDRAEEWRVDLDRRGRIVRLRHLLPEGAPGESLTEERARTLALETTRERFGLEGDRLREVSAEAHQRPDRRDWTFVFADEGTLLEEGEARVEVRIGGMAIVDAHRTVHVPEEWRRQERSRDSRHAIRVLAGGGFLLFVLGGLAVYALVRWSRSSFHVQSFTAVGGALFLGLALRGLNGFPSGAVGMSTARPMGHQVAMLAGGTLLGGLFVAAVAGLLAGLVPVWSRRRRSGWPASAFAGLGAGALVAGLGALTGLGEPLRLPALPDYSGAGHFVTWLAPLLEAGTALVVGGAALGAVATAVEVLGRGTRGRRAAVTAASSALIGFGFAAVEVGPSTFHWLASGAAWSGAMAGVVWLVRRAGRAALPLVVALPVVLEQVEALVSSPYPGARPGAALAVVLVLGAALVWSRSLSPGALPDAGPRAARPPQPGGPAPGRS